MGHRSAGSSKDVMLSLLYCQRQWTTSVAGAGGDVTLRSCMLISSALLATTHQGHHDTILIQYSHCRLLAPDSSSLCNCDVATNISQSSFTKWGQVFIFDSCHKLHSNLPASTLCFHSQGFMLMAKWQTTSMPSSTSPSHKLAHTAS